MAELTSEMDDDTAGVVEIVPDSLQSDVAESTEQKLFRELGKDEDSAKKAFNMLFKETAKPIVRFLGARGLQKADAEDVLHTVYMKLFAQRGKLAAVENARAYLWMMVRNAHTDVLRKQGRLRESIESEFANDDDDDGMDSFADTKQLDIPECVGLQKYTDCVSEVIQRWLAVRPRYRHVIEHIVYGRLSLKELAEVLGRKDGATRQAVSDMKTRLAARIRNGCGEPPGDSENGDGSQRRGAGQ